MGSSFSSDILKKRVSGLNLTHIDWLKNKLTWLTYKLTWLTYKVSGLCLVCWVPLCVCLAASGVRGYAIVNAFVITSTVGYYNYVLNPLVYRGIMKTKANNVQH